MTNQPMIDSQASTPSGLAEGVALFNGHAADCDYHCDQYEFECTCGRAGVGHGVFLGHHIDCDWHVDQYDFECNCSGGYEVPQWSKSDC